MAVKITITKKMEETLRALAEDAAIAGTTSATMARQLISKCDDARATKERVKGLSPQDAIRIIRNILGPAATLPPTQTPAFYSFIKKRIDFLGLTAENVECIAMKAKRTYKLPTSVQWIMTTADRLLDVSDSIDSIDSGEGAVNFMTGRGDG